MTLVFRPYRHTDYPALVSIVKDTWGYEQMASPKVAALLAEVFVSSCLCNATHSIVAQADGDVAVSSYSRTLRVTAARGATGGGMCLGNLGSALGGGA